MEKKLNKPYSRNIRLGEPCGLLGTPPDAPLVSCRENVVIVARANDAQVKQIVNILQTNPKKRLTQ